MIKKILIFLLIVFIVLQFFRPEKNIAAGPEAFKNNVATVFPTSEPVKKILSESCNDCHSNNTRYPWYNNVQPFAWMLADHIKEGKKELNFDEFSTFTPRRQYRKFEEVIEEVQEGHMPESSYVRMHKEAELTSEEKELIYSWAKAGRASLEASYPMDSLVRKK